MSAPPSGSEATSCRRERTAVTRWRWRRRSTKCRRSPSRNGSCVCSVQSYLLLDLTAGLLRTLTDCPLNLRPSPGKGYCEPTALHCTPGMNSRLMIVVLPRASIVVWNPSRSNISYVPVNRKASACGRPCVAVGTASTARAPSRSITSIAFPSRSSASPRRLQPRWMKKHPTNQTPSADLPVNAAGLDRLVQSLMRHLALHVVPVLAFCKPPMPAPAAATCSVHAKQCFQLRPEPRFQFAADDTCKCARCIHVSPRVFHECPAQCQNPAWLPAGTPLLDDSPAAHALSSLIASLGFVTASFLLALTTLEHARDVPCLIKARLDSHNLKHPFETRCRAEERGHARSSKSLHNALGLSLPCNNNDFRVLIHHSSLPASQGDIKMPAVQHPPDPAQRSNYEQRLKSYQPHGGQFVPAGYSRRNEYTQKNAVDNIEQQRVAPPLSEDGY